MISANYVDGLELRIRELQKKISDEANASLHLIAESKSLKAERDALSQKLRAAQHEAEALAATVEALRDAWEAVKATDWNKPLEEAFATTPQQHMRDVRAEAISGALKILSHRWKSDTEGDAAFVRVSELIEYAERVRAGGK